MVNQRTKVSRSLALFDQRADRRWRLRQSIHRLADLLADPGDATGQRGDHFGADRLDRRRLVGDRVLCGNQRLQLGDQLVPPPLVLERRHQRLDVIDIDRLRFGLRERGLGADQAQPKRQRYLENGSDHRGGD